MRVAIYCRLSDEDRDKTNPDDDSESIQNQKNMLLKYAVDQGWEVYDIYSDDDYAGSDRDRPDFKRLLKDGESRRFQIILCKTQSRFSRELEIVEKYIHGLFPQWGIRFIGLVDNADTEVKGNKKSRQINGLVNEWYLEDLSENVCSALDHKRSVGQYIASFALYGYRKSELDRNKLVIDEPAARVVRRIFTLYVEGHGLWSITRTLNDEGVPNPTWYKKEQGLKVMGKSRFTLSSHWSVSTVRCILANVMYTGDMVQGKQEKASYKSKKLRRVPSDKWFVVKSTHEAIIDRPMWEAAQERLVRHSKMGMGGTVHLFAGKAFCLQCGMALHANSSKGHKYLRCPVGDVSSKHCGGARIPLDLLETHVLQQINALCCEYYDESLVMGQVTIKNSAELEMHACREELSMLEAKAEEHSKALLALYTDKVKGTVPEGIFEVLSNQLMKETGQTQQQKERLIERIGLLEQRLVNAQSKADIINSYRQFNALTRELVGELIERIEVGRRDAQTNSIKVKIFWKI
jgi:site-specific DNA recombinase